MANPKFELSRRQLLGGIGTISVASAGAGLGTSAYFSDQETFENNRITAYEIDLMVDWEQTYNGDPVSAYPDTDGDGRQDAIEARGDIAADAGLPVDSSSVETTFREQFANLPDDWSAPLIDLHDVKPGDEGEVTLSTHLFDMAGYVWLGSPRWSAAENGLTEPERDDLDEVDSASTPPADRESDLLDRIDATLWYDDGDNRQETDETTIVEGTLRTVLCRLDGGLALDADPSTATRDCFAAESTSHVGLRWSLPVDQANEVQSDSVQFTLGFATEQCAANDGSAAPFADAVVTPGDSIQTAVDAAAPGDVIKISAGTYVEQVVIDRPLTLVGAGPDETVVESPETLAVSYDRPDRTGGGTATQYPVVFVDGVEATLCGLTVDGANNAAGNYQFDGIGFRNGSGRIVDVETTRTANDPFSGAQHGNGITVFNTDGTSRRVGVHDSAVHDYQKVGIVGDGQGLTLVVTDTTVTGRGPTDVNGQNGIQVSFGAVGSLSRNVVTDNVYTPETNVATGVIGYNAADVTLSENRLSANELGFATLGTDAVARRNDFVDSTRAGVANYGGGTVDARRNWWGAASGPSGSFTDPETGATPSGSGDAVVDARWDPFLTSSVTQ
ncbi:SipW-dependent-type signal peptide-containing protein [Haloplanus litoreus]|uniref:SipW-dependent-type signal peptide-containing protein n=1 Tax=Haloplanus litoreus TaxID=767515 RepID=A0ABD5ZVD1_9EURY